MGIITVTCPKCREVMEINTVTGKIEKHHAEVKVKPGGDFLKERLKTLEEDKLRREALVAEGRKKEQSKKAVADKLFDKVKEHAKDGKPVERPLRDIDID